MKTVKDSDKSLFVNSAKTIFNENQEAIKTDINNSILYIIIIKIINFIKVSYYMISILLIILMIHHALIDTNTQTNDQIIQFFAFLAFSSSHIEIRYIIQDIIIDITAITATYLINKIINLVVIQNTTFQLKFSAGIQGSSITVSVHQGNQIQLNSGALFAAKTSKKKNVVKTRIESNNIFFIFFIN
ncbi:MAG: hypothetical protein U9Q66_02465 [Patescibacteria group bacterium]|nr:hypothetical protein [Patescibacteria group bacterium]